MKKIFHIAFFVFILALAAFDKSVPRVLLATSAFFLVTAALADYSEEEGYINLPGMRIVLSPTLDRLFFVLLAAILGFLAFKRMAEGVL